MAPPTPLSVATKSINRLLKEESSYRTELVNQQQRVEKLQAGGGTEEVAGNTEFRLRQEVSTPPSSRLVRVEKPRYKCNGCRADAGTETSHRRNKSGLWTSESADCGCGGEVGGAVGRSFSINSAVFSLDLSASRERGMCGAMFAEWS